MGDDEYRDVVLVEPLSQTSQHAVCLAVVAHGAYLGDVVDDDDRGAELEELLLQRPGVDLSKLLSPEDMQRLEQLRQEKTIVKAGIEEFGKKANAELGKLHKAIGEAKDKDAKAAAEIAFKARLQELEKAFAPLQERQEKAESEISALLQKAREAQKAARAKG